MATFASSHPSRSSCEQRRGRLVPLQGPPVEREEQPLEAGQRGVGQVGPHRAHHLVTLAADGLCGGGQSGLGPRLHLPGDVEQQAVLGAEVVQEHPVAGPDRPRNAAETLVGQPIGREVLDHGVEQPLPG